MAGAGALEGPRRFENSPDVLRLMLRDRGGDRRRRATDPDGQIWLCQEDGRWAPAEPPIATKATLAGTSLASDIGSTVCVVPTKLEKHRRASRPQERISDIAERPYSAISMFSGCGGLDLGAITAGVKVRWANDWDKPAVDTYKKNIGDHIVHGDARGLEPPREACDVLIAGPPCQDFSTLWTHEGALTQRGNLYREVARFLASLGPPAFVLENVRGLLSANEGRAWMIVRSALRAPQLAAARVQGGREASKPARVNPPV
jgi:hypothetical protein